MKHSGVKTAVYLDNMPRGVTLSDPISMARAMPGASRSITSRVACETTPELNETVEKLDSVLK